MAIAKEERLLIAGPAGNLQVAAYLDRDEGPFDEDFCAVVCHPHPLHGGAMDNKVVTTLVRAYRELDVPVARFNFRGVGDSDGVHDNGVGEIDDLKAVVDWIVEKTDAAKILLAGFSFGTGVVSNYVQTDSRVAHTVFVAPPVGRYNFAPVAGYNCPVCVVMGDQDELVDAEEVYAWAAGLQPLPEVVRMPEATHFFHGQLVTMRQQLLAVIEKQLLV